MPVYFIKPSVAEVVKIGYTQDVSSRLAALQTASWADLSVLATVSDNDFTEKELHRAFKKFRIRGEWFLYNECIREFLRAYAMNPSYASCFISTKPLSRWVGHTSSYR